MSKWRGCSTGNGVSLMEPSFPDCPEVRVIWAGSQVDVDCTARWAEPFTRTVGLPQGRAQHSQYRRAAQAPADGCVGMPWRRLESRSAVSVICWRITGWTQPMLGGETAPEPANSCGTGGRVRRANK